ncbi:MAG TPA: ATP-binding protein [Rectinemataceae bacterium]|nr:ATP-binding protein [Rectinemataceae bacterium]
MKTCPAPRLRIVAITVVLMLSSAALLAAPRDDPLYVDLTAAPLFVRVGFDESQINSLPAAGDGIWKMLPPTAGGDRNVRPIDLHLPGVPHRRPFSLASYPTMEFTYLIPFAVSPAMARAVGAGAAVTAAAGVAPSLPGIHFAGLGDDWQIFLNGVLVKSELHLSHDGRILKHRDLRDVHFPLDGRLFHEGTNILAVRIVADPTFAPAGFDQAKPYFIDDYQNIVRLNAEVGPMVLIGLYLFIGLYHIFMFLVRPKDRHNLFYGLFSVDLGIYLFVRTYTATLFVLDSDLIMRVEFFTLFFILPLVGAFLEILNDARIKKITLWYGAFCAALAVVELVTPAAFAFDVLRVWQFSGLVMAFYYFGVDILGRFLSEGRRRWKRERDSEGARSLGRIYLQSLVRTPIGNLLIGGLILFITAVFDIIDAVYLQWDLVLTKYGFFLFTMGTALILANRLGFLHDRLSGLNVTLEERIRVLTETGVRLAASERRYRSLFDGSAEPVALLTADLAFIEGNRAATDFFGLGRSGRSVTRLVDAVYAEKREGTLPVDMLRDAARSQEAGAGPREINLRLKSPIGEPRPCKLRLERIDSLERKEILLRVTPEGKDALAEFFVEGRERFDIESSLTAADEICRRASSNLAKYTDEESAGFLGLCLREVVVNAVEHGNLQVTFAEKSARMKEGRYFEFLQERRLDPRYRSRRVSVEYSVSAARATYRVTDEGPGFDHRRFLSSDGQPSEELLEHGRGLFMTRSAFDTVQFNERGNQVTLVKYFGA